ncbi:type VI secretion system Vgr family protein [Pedobacter sp. GR22-10]|uniref:type VI secretion system Vgr family protein n=1 Tax=Pedobacter sp. GR22-10 TaxID=2994472 RepID=UPI00224815A0|nr:phage baseplate assembly protein V [Pedobacter sp. GR22-10]MCX2432410.1 phage baseplate assembly protein V [Pedobacter sp. GR22-10]
MENKLIVEINIEDTPIAHFASFNLVQAFNQHHYFELHFNHDQLGTPGLINLDDSRDFVGKTLTASFGHSPERQQHFSGLVTKVELSQSHGYHGVLIVSGYSPTILIDRGQDLGSYLDKDLNDIVKLATKDTPVNDLKIVANASRQSSIDYLIQYKESDWEFMNRLSGEYHEWLYYDGQQLNFGKPDEQKDVSLFYGRDVHSLQYAMEVAPIKNKRFAYNPKQDEMLHSESSGKADGHPDLAHAIKASNNMFSKTFNQPSLIRVDNGNDIKSHVENEEKAHISELLKVNGSGDNAELGIGTIAEITMSIRQEIAFATESLGKFLITSVNHTLDGTGKYSNTFEGLVSTTERLLVKNYDKPSPDMQLADVLDNDDPQGQGRIKVRFKWECQTNDPTEWLRVVSPNAGSGDTGKNRGFHVIPEKGDQVVIAFEEGNVARPVVIGSVYHGKSGDSAGFKNSNTKGLTSRKGSALTFDDLNHALNLGTNGANFVKVENGPGQITAESAETIVIRTGDSSITLKKDGTIDIVGKIINIQGTDAINANAGNMPGTAVNMGTVGTTAVNVGSKTYNLESQGTIIVCSDATISQTSGGVQTITGSQVDIN